MNIANSTIVKECHEKPEILRELMSYKVGQILLISSLYNMFILEEYGSLTSKIINEYKGLNLNNPPNITGASSLTEAFYLLDNRTFDLVIVVSDPSKKDVLSLGKKIKQTHPRLPVILLLPPNKGFMPLQEKQLYRCFDKFFIWSGNHDLLLALIKNIEDQVNARRDTQLANVRVLILVEDSPEYASFFLPILYKEIVRQTQALVKIGLNDSKKLFTVQTRPKILLARNYEEAIELYKEYREFLFCVISDTEFPRRGVADPKAGIRLLSQIRKENPICPLLLMSSESANAEHTSDISSEFIDKNTPELSLAIKNFLMVHLGFGDFVFRNRENREIARASNLLRLEAQLYKIPDTSIRYHADQHHFSNWLMARSEIDLALKFRSVSSSDFSNISELREYIISNIHELRKQRQKGVISTFRQNHFDSNVREFVKIGNGSLGGKARGLAFLSVLIGRHSELQNKYPDINIRIPRTLVICTDIFEAFVTRNKLQHFMQQGVSDEEVTQGFLEADMPEWLIRKLSAYLAQIKVPLAVRSSSQLADVHSQPYTGLYPTYMIPNNHPDLSVRVSHLVRAIKMIYASAYYGAAKLFSINTTRRPFNDSMAVIVQELTGDEYGDYFYPAVSGVAQSTNFYPFAHMHAEDGVANIAVGFGKTVIENGKSLRFSPAYPAVIPQFSNIADTLKQSQNSFYALKIKNNLEDLSFQAASNLEKRDIDSAVNEFPFKLLTSTYVQEENRIRDTWHAAGPKVVTFASILKYNALPVSELLCDLLDLGRKGLGGDVEIEFSINLYPDKNRKSDLFFLQIQPMNAEQKHLDAEISENEVNRSFARSTRAFGNGINEKITDIVYVKPNDFKPEKTMAMAEEISRLNTQLCRSKRAYMLVGPGRWGSSDRWLGIPVKWPNISGAAAIVELKNKNIDAEASQGSHFFHNITSQGIQYIMIDEIHKNNVNGFNDYFDWEWANSLPAVSETTFIRHVRLKRPMKLKIDGKTSKCVMTAG